jgi:predicted unusual protein kinase regulating ubiquinone biosynthesis (AarF/ABC1/UbiB family)
MRTPGASPWALFHRASVLASLIAEAAFLYARHALARRAGWRSGEVDAARFSRFASRFVRIATRFRGGLIKLGQVASLRVEVLPEAITDELAKLRDRVESHPYEEIAAQIEHELGAPIPQFFRSFEHSPIAAASLGQVHRAAARDGRDLALKVLYPGVERSVAIDLAMARVALWLFDFVVVADLAHVHREIRRSIRGEMDYVREGRAAEEMAGNLAKDPELREHVRAPAIHWDLTTRRVLAMEFIEGVKIDDLDGSETAGLTRDEIVLWASRAFLHMMFRDGFFHCDPHPGNLIVEPCGRLAIIDFGMNERLSPAMLAAVRRNVLASVMRDADLFAQSLVESGAIEPADVPVVRELAELSFDPEMYNLTPQEMVNLDFGETFRRSRELMKRLRSFRIPEGIVMWWRATSVLYGLIVELAPGLRPLDVFGPYVLTFMSGALPEGSSEFDKSSDSD